MSSAPVICAASVVVVCLLLALAVSLAFPSNRVECPECDGAGEVVYESGDPVVEAGLPPGTYVCPICRGEGYLVKEGR